MPSFICVSSKLPRMNNQAIAYQQTFLSPCATSNPVTPTYISLTYLELRVEWAHTGSNDKDMQIISLLRSRWCHICCVPTNIQGRSYTTCSHLIYVADRWILGWIWVIGPYGCCILEASRGSETYNMVRERWYAYSSGNSLPDTLTEIPL
jgi:hypothetical protein